ncbi:MAG: TRAP transporter large permease [Burkholderiales bacterium]|nr:TRAP transporter large permease [Burkholderiales bacterium]
MEYLPILLMFVLFALNIPVAFGMGVAALTYFLFAVDLPLGTFIQRLTSVTASFPLLAVPFFILAGSIMNYAGITRRLMTLADALVGHWMGGLAQVNILLSTLMGGLSASALADAAMQAKMLGPEMIKRGMSPGFAAAITACAAIITPIIPPGIGLIIYGYLSDQSVGRLFIGGIIPGLLLCLALMITTYFISRRRDYRPTRTRFVSLGELGRAFRDALWALSIPLFIVLGIRDGIFTPTEAGAICVLYAAFIGFFVHRELKLRDIPAIITEATVGTSATMIIVSAAAAFGYYMTWEDIPAHIASSLIGVTREPWLLLLLINLVLVVVGMLVETTSAIILLTPILVPAVMQLGIDPIHFGLILVVNLTIGGVTPPVGTVMYVSCSILRVPINRFTVEALPLILTMFAVLFLITYFPQIVLFLPNLWMGKS